MTEIDTNSQKGSGCLGWLGWVLGINLFWILLAAFTAYLGWRSYTLSTNGAVATGTVVSFVEDEQNAYFSDIYPVVEFEVNGETYSVRSQNNYRWWNRYTRFVIGKQVEMRYDPEDPENAEINSWLDLWGEPLILGVFSIICAIIGNGFLFFRWRMGRAQAAIGM